MHKQSSPSQFLTRAETDPQLSARVAEAIEHGGNVTMDAVLRIADEAGFSFTREEFQEASKRRMEQRFSVGEVSAELSSKKRAPMSACSRGFLSWTISYCPTRDFEE
jgi:predicted ribosomally synthesized peptide with nif11-like leader